MVYTKHKIFICLILLYCFSSSFNYYFHSPPETLVQQLFHDTANSISFKLVGQVGGPIQAVAVKDNYAYIGIGMRMVVLDVSNASSIQQVGETSVFDGFVTGVAISGTTICITVGVAGLHIVDISSPAQPSLLGSCDTLGYAENVFIEGSYAYVADGWSGLTVLDISDETSPQQIGSLSTIGYAFDVAIADNTAYVAAAGAGLKIVDVQYPEGPIEIGEYDTTGYAFGVAFSNGVVYIADGWAGLQVIDVSDPSLPSSLVSITTPGWAFDVATEGNTLYVADAFKGLRVMDISSPRFPSEVGAFEPEERGHAGRVVIAGGRAYIADRSNGLIIVDVSNKSSSTQVGLYSCLGYAEGVTVSGNYAYVAAGSYGLRIIDISSPSQAKELGNLDTKNYANRVSVKGNYTYLTTLHGAGEDEGLHIIDTSNPSSPRRLQFHQTGSSRDLTVSGEIACIANEWGLELIDISDPLNPFEAGFISLCDQLSKDATIGVDVSGTLAYVTQGFEGLKIVDISNVANPILIGNFKTESSFSQDVTVVGNRAYVADGFGLRILDVSNPANPSEMGYIETQKEALEVYIDGNIAYVASGSSGVSVVDISNPNSPNFLKYYNTPGYSHSLIVKDGRLYVADGNAGLLIFEIQSTSQSNQKRFDQRSHLLMSPQSIGRHSLIHNPQKRTNFVKAGAFPTQLTTNTAINKLDIFNTWVVNTTADSGEGSLSWCIENAQQGDIITFNASVFQPDNPSTIAVLSQIPWIIQGNITIDASDAGVILDGRNLGNATGIILNSDGNIIRGLQIINFSNGVYISGDGNTIGGDRAKGAGPVGQGNVISGNSWCGVVIEGDSNIIIGNLIGTDVTGTILLGNGQHGMHIFGKNNRIGGTAPWERNIVSGSGINGVSLHFEGSHDNSVIGNYIGTDINGNLVLRNEGHGVGIEQGAFHNLVKGNLINGSGRFGVCISDWGSSYNSIVGNIIGLDGNGQKALGNDEAGVFVGYWGASFNRVGGTSPEEGNIISGNSTGIILTGPGAVDNFVMANLIGTDSAGKNAIGNFSGILVMGGECNFMGGMSNEEGNVISGNIYAIALDHGDYSFVGGNYIGMSADGISTLHNDYEGISVQQRISCTAIVNNLISGDPGIALYGDENILMGNAFTQSSCGLQMSGNNNVIYYNKFLNNQPQAYDSGSNNWDMYSAGNYWSDYIGSDADGDGIGDTPYSISENVKDNYPLMSESNRLTVQVSPPGSGSVTVIPNKVSYRYGENVRLIAIPTGEKSFSFWSGGYPSGHEKDNPLMVRMNSDRTITANLKEQYKLILESGTGGTTDPSPGSYKYNEGTSVTIKAIPDTGYKFSEWTGNVPSGHQNDNPLTVTMDSDKSIKANFIKIPSDSGRDTEGRGGCFIATACYGTHMAEEVKALCAFRDQYLITNPAGRALVKLYYSFSPKVAEYVRDKEGLKAIIRECLKPIIKAIRKAAKIKSTV